MTSFEMISGTRIRTDGSILRIARIDGDKYRFVDNPQAIVEGLRHSSRRADLFTFLQRLPDTTPRYSYPIEWDNFAVLPLTTFDDWWTKQIGFKARNKAKQAAKHGVIVREVSLDNTVIRGIWEIYNETPIRQGRRFPHYGMTLDRIADYAGTFPDSSIFIGAFFDDKLIGFVKLTVDETGIQAGLMHIVSMISHRDKAPTNALLAQAVRSCTDRHVAHLVYSNFAYGNKQTDSLSDFKERNGFRRIDVPRYYVPLTPLGSIAFRLGLHRRLIDFVPEPFLARFREFRKAWYERKLQVSPKEVL